MKIRMLFSMLLCILGFLAFSQVPDKINYQAVARDGSGSVLANKVIGIRISILDGSSSGPVLYSESHTKSTNDYGMFHLEVGGGSPLSGTFSGIDWVTGMRFLRVEVDPAGGINYTNMGESQILSVAFALHARTSSVTSALGSGSQGQTLRHNGTNWSASSLLMNNGSQIGIGTSSPSALLHVYGIGAGNGNILFTGEYKTTPGNPPASGSGTRMMWYPDKAAFRAGRVTGNNWNKDSIGNYSFGTGMDIKAKGESSVALGSMTQATGNSSTAMGLMTKATGSYSLACGSSTTASGSVSTALGSNNIASGSSSLVAGEFSSSSGTGSIALGVGTTASGGGSTALGYNTTATVNSSTAIGDNVTAYSYAETAIGRYNQVYTPASATGWDLSDRLLVIANGSSSSSKSNAITVLKNGRVGLQTSTSPTYALELPNNTSTGIGQGRAYAWATYSDERIKSDIRTLPYGLKEVLQLRPVKYFQHNSLNENGELVIAKHGKQTIGFLAQEINQVIPEVVNKPDQDENELWSMSYDKLVPVLTKAIQEQQAVIARIEQRLQALEMR